ncbi:hypothetical protein FACS189447_06430 [Spirochaetia bacterium]|nr:hypothetical protein FACS189447_06430 [Spirochaetia bacterium]
MNDKEMDKVMLNITMEELEAMMPQLLKDLGDFLDTKYRQGAFNKTRSNFKSVHADYTTSSTDGQIIFTFSVDNPRVDAPGFNKGQEAEKGIESIK